MFIREVVPYLADMFIIEVVPYLADMFIIEVEFPTLLTCLL